MSEPSSLRALSDGAALVARTDRGVIRVAGADRASWLQGLLTNDIVALAPRQGCYAAWLTPQGRMISDAVVLAHQDTITLEVAGSIGEDLYRRLDGAIFAEDVLLTDECGVWASLGVHGPRAAEVVARALVGSRPPDDVLEAGTLDAWPPYANDGVGQAGVLARDDQYGVPGFVVRVPIDVRDLWTSRLRLAGAVVTSAADLEFARIEAGRPEFLIDMDADTIPLEAGIEDRAISFSKGCYVGQEVIVRIVHRGGGRVARRLVGLRLAGTVLPLARAGLSSGGKDAGRVTSAAWSPRLSCPVALGYVRRDLAQPGTTLAVDCDGGPAEATVTAFPIG